MRHMRPRVGSGRSQTCQTRERMEGQYITGQPKVAAQWAHRKTGLKSQRGDVISFRSKGTAPPRGGMNGGLW